MSDLSFSTVDYEMDDELMCRESDELLNSSDDEMYVCDDENTLNLSEQKTTKETIAQRLQINDVLSQTKDNAGTLTVKKDVERAVAQPVSNQFASNLQNTNGKKSFPTCAAVVHPKDTSFNLMKVQSNRNEGERSTTEILPVETKAWITQMEPQKPLTIQMEPKASTTYQNDVLIQKKQSTVPNQNPAPRIPFVIEALPKGASVTRKVSINPNFKGWLPIGNRITNKSEQRFSLDCNSKKNTTLTIGDLRHVLRHKQTERKTTEPEKLKLPVPEPYDKSKNYLMQMKNQKMRREEYLREKESCRRQQESEQDSGGRSFVDYGDDIFQ